MQNYLSSISLNSCLLVGTKSSISNFQTINSKVHNSPKQIKILNPIKKKKKKNSKPFILNLTSKQTIVEGAFLGSSWAQAQRPVPPKGTRRGKQCKWERDQGNQPWRGRQRERERERERGLRIELRCLNCLKFKLNVLECLKLTQISVVFSYFDFFFSFLFCV